MRVCASACYTTLSVYNCFVQVTVGNFLVESCLELVILPAFLLSFSPVANHQVCVVPNVFSNKRTSA